MSSALDHHDYHDIVIMRFRTQAEPQLWRQSLDSSNFKTQSKCEFFMIVSNINLRGMWGRSMTVDFSEC